MTAARSPEPEPLPPIRLAIPADFRYLRVARVTAAAIAADLDFSVQDIDDVRVAVDELSALLIEDATGGGGAGICFALGGGGLDVDGRVTGGSVGRGEPPPRRRRAPRPRGRPLRAWRSTVRVAATFRFRKQPGGGQE